MSYYCVKTTTFSSINCQKMTKQQQIWYLRLFSRCLWHRKKFWTCPTTSLFVSPFAPLQSQGWRKKSSYHHLRVLGHTTTPMCAHVPLGQKMLKDLMINGSKKLIFIVVYLQNSSGKTKTFKSNPQNAPFLAKNSKIPHFGQ